MNVADGLLLTAAVALIVYLVVALVSSSSSAVTMGDSLICRPRAGRAGYPDICARCAESGRMAQCGSDGEVPGRLGEPVPPWRLWPAPRCWPAARG